jgi:hypothetical protein
MHRIATVIAALIVAALVSVLTAGRLAHAADAPSELAYGLVDPNANGPGNPGFEVQHNMAGVRRLGTGRYCLRAAVPFDDGPLVIAAADGVLSDGRFALALSDTQARYCNRGLQEIAVATFIIIHGAARPSNAVRFVGDSIG